MLALRLASVAASLAFAQQHDAFTQLDYSLYVSTNHGKVPTPWHIVPHLAQVNATLSFCNGTNDLIAVTFIAPIVDEVSPDMFSVHLCRLPPDDNWDVFPERGTCVHNVNVKCATLSPADEANERRTVLLAGQFTKGHMKQRFSYGPTMLRVSAMTLSADGEMVERGGTSPMRVGGSHGWCAHLMHDRPTRVVDRLCARLMVNVF